MKLSTAARAVLLFVFAVASFPALATFPYSSASGTFSGTLMSCTDPADNGPDSGSFSVSFFDADDLGNVHGIITAGGQTFTQADFFYDGSSVSFSGSISSPSIDGGTDYLTSVNLTISGGGTFSLSYSGYNLDGDGCSFSGTGSGTFTTVIFNPDIAAPSSIINNTETLNQTVSTMVTTLSARIQNAFRGKAGLKRVAGGVMYDTGMNAGDGNSSITGVWGSYSRTTFENDFYRTAYDGDRSMFMGGVDFATADNVIVGISVAYENADVDTAFSNDPTGVVVNYGAADSNGYTIAPYVGITLDDTWNIDISGGISSIDTEQNRAGGTITSDYDTDRLFASVNLNGFKQIDRWFLTGRIGGLYTESEDEQYTESDNTFVSERKIKLGQFQLGGEAAYEIGEWEPYIGGTYRYDMTSTNTELTNTGVAGDQPSNDDSDFMLSAGVRFYSKEGLTMSLGYDKLYGRDDYDEETVMFNARWDF